MRPSLRLLSAKRNLVGCEVGVDGGHNALVMLVCLHIEKLYLIDYWKNLRAYEEAKKRLVDFTERTVWLKKMSVDVTNEDIPRESLDFAYIDGGHTYDVVKMDLQNYWPRIKPDGMFCGHDYMREKWVRKAVNEFGDARRLRVYYFDQDWWIWKE